MRALGGRLGSVLEWGCCVVATAAPKLLDNASFEQWTADGALDANQRVLRRAQEMLRSCEPPPMDEAVDEAPRENIAKREAELPEGVK